MTTDERTRMRAVALADVEHGLKQLRRLNGQLLNAEQGLRDLRIDVETAIDMFRNVRAALRIDVDESGHPAENPPDPADPGAGARDSDA